jgi:predicted component of type VI protein secretion system
MDGVNSIGRHDDCVIRIRSSQVSRRHCELFEEENKLILRDLGSSNGTFVNGKRVLGKQALKPGDVLTIGGVTLRVDLLHAASNSSKASSAPQPAAGDTAVVNALPDAEDDFEIELEPDEEFDVALGNEPDHLDIVPLDDEPPPSHAPKAAQPAAAVKDQAEKAKGSPGSTGITEPPPKPQSADEEDAVAQFLMDLKLDEDD